MRRRLMLVVAAAVAAPAVLAGQDRLRALPAYERYQRVFRESAGAAPSPGSGAEWTDDGTGVEFVKQGTRYRFDLATKRTTEVTAAADGRRRRGQAGADREPPARGRQFTTAMSPDGRLKAFYRDRNVFISAADGSGERAVTTDGSAASRVKYGTASWVYGEELDQVDAMWWSPDGRRLAYYRFDESRIPDYYVLLDQTGRQDEVDAEPYPTAGKPNPIVDLYVYDLGTGRSTKVDVRDGKPFTNDVIGYYVYRVSWSPDGRELLFLRTNRRQNVMELAAADPATGACRVVLREAWPTGWLNEQRRLVFLNDGRRFIWDSQRNGWNNFYLYDLSGRLITPLTRNTTFEVGTLIKIDEKAGVVFYTAHDGDNPLKLQLHRVGLDGRNDRRLTDPAYHHTVGSCVEGAEPRVGEPHPTAPCGISPDGRSFIDVYQTHDTPPAMRIGDAATGRTVAEVSHSDMAGFERLGLRKAELFTFTAADGRTPLYGLLEFPSDFDPGRTYPSLVNVYGGPEFATSTARETFVTPSAFTELGFLVVTVESRAVPDRGRRALDAIYERVGQAEMDDMADGIKALWARPYFDKARVGIFGTSYGGYTSLIELLRHPEVFAAASAASPVTDWRNYDTIYTERYMWIPEENQAGYDAASAVVHANDLKGRLLLYYGTADNNVHPSNALQLIAALQKAGKHIDLVVGPDIGHSSFNVDRMMEFFVDALGRR